MAGTKSVAACKHLNVLFQRIAVGDGRFLARWRCRDCEQGFSPLMVEAPASFAPSVDRKKLDSLSQKAAQQIAEKVVTVDRADRIEAAAAIISSTMRPLVEELAFAVTDRDKFKKMVNNEYRASIGEVWHWQNDADDELDSLVSDNNSEFLYKFNPSVVKEAVMQDPYTFSEIVDEGAAVGFEMDGDQWCANRLPKTNLMEQETGFGDTPMAALVDLIKQEKVQ